MKKTIGAWLALGAAVLIGLSVYHAAEGALSQGGACTTGVSSYVIARHCPEGTAVWALGIPVSVFLLLLGLGLHGLKDDLRGAWLYQGFFLSLGLGILFASQSADDAASRWFGVGMFVLMAPIGSGFLIQEWVRRRRAARPR